MTARYILLTNYIPAALIFSSFFTLSVLNDCCFLLCNNFHFLHPFSLKQLPTLFLPYFVLFTPSVSDSYYPLYPCCTVFCSLLQSITAITHSVPSVLCSLHYFSLLQLLPLPTLSQPYFILFTPSVLKAITFIY